MPKPRVTVCIPVYNMEKYVAETLDSLQAQTYQDYEAIIVNDGSTDSSKDIITPYLSDPRFRYIYQDNKGLAGARNTALAVAEGEWFAQLDSDDMWTPDKLELQIALADEDPNANFVYANVLEFRDDGWQRVAYDDSMMPEGDLTPYFYTTNFVAGSAVMVKTAVLRELGGYPIQKLGEDYTTWLKLCQRGIWARIVRKPVVLYRIRANSLLAPRLPNIMAQAVIMSEALAKEHRPRQARMLRKGLDAVKRAEFYERARIAARNGEGGVATHLVRSAGFNKQGLKRLLMAGMFSLSRIPGLRRIRDRAIPALQGENPRDYSDANAT